MFNYNSLVLINSNTDATSGKTKVSASNGVLKILREGNYKASNVVSAYKRAGSNAVLSTATFTTPTAPSTSGAVDYYRISLAMKLVDSQASTMAAAGTIYKSKLIHIEFKVSYGDTAATVAANMVKAVKFYQENLYAYITPSNVSNALKITANDEFEIFNSATIEKMVTNSTSVYPEDINKFDWVSSATIANGSRGFGTYSYILRNLRLPTIANLRYASPTEDQMPVLGGLYNQYTIEYRVDRGQLGGGSAVSQDIKSTTTHIFYVLSTVATAFETALSTAGITLEEESGTASVTVTSGLTVVKGSTLGLTFVADGTTKSSGGTWTIVGTAPAGASISGSTLTTTSSTPVGTIAVHVVYQDNEADGTVSVTAA